MAGLGRFLAPAAEVRAQATTWGDWPGETVPTWAGISVSSESAMQLLAVYGAVRLITDQISTLPIDCFRELGDGSKQEISRPAWLMNPTVDLTFTEWCTQVLSSLLLHGNAYVQVTRNERQAIVELVPMDPGKVSVTRENRRKVYRVDGRPFTGELVHIKGLMMPGADVGLSPLEAARQSIGLGLSATQYGAQFFDGEGNMPGVIEIPNKAQPEAMTAMAQAWKRKRSRMGKGLPGVLESGATWKPTGVTNEQAQFLSTRKFSAAEIAGQMFLVDPSDLGIPVEGTSLTYANLEQRNARRVQVTLLPWIVRVEAAISALLFQPRYMKFNVEGLLRGDTLNRYQSYAVGIQSGFLMPEEARDYEDLPPIPGQMRPPGEEPLNVPNA
jgi:HK97 family phage portal protein